MKALRRLHPRARSRLTTAFLQQPADGAPVVADVVEHIAPFRREVDVEPVVNLIDHAMAKLNPVESDAWLAPRIHACLRLYRSEAADPRIWAYIAVVETPAYVRWRWPGADERGTPPERFMGPQYKQALARLWWGAELTRNGPDYAATLPTFRMQDIPNQWLRYDLFHHRPAALAAVRFLAALNEGRGGTHDEVVQLAKAFNLALTTTVLDVIAANPDPDMPAVEDWLEGPIDETLLYEHEPVGPPEPQVPEESIAPVEAMLARIAREARIVGSQRREQNGDGGVKSSWSSDGWILERGEVYSRDLLKSRFAIGDASLFNGVFIPPGEGHVWLFVTEQKTRDRTQYRDLLDGDTLYWDGQTAGGTDKLITDHEKNGIRILVFYRKKKYEYPNAAFRLEGEFRYVSHTGANPTHFNLQRVTKSEVPAQSNGGEAQPVAT